MTLTRRHMKTKRSVSNSIRLLDYETLIDKVIGQKEFAAWLIEQLDVPALWSCHGWIDTSTGRRDQVVEMQYMYVSKSEMLTLRENGMLFSGTFTEYADPKFVPTLMRIVERLRARRKWEIGIFLAVIIPLLAVGAYIAFKLPLGVVNG